MTSATRERGLIVRTLLAKDKKIAEKGRQPHNLKWYFLLSNYEHLLLKRSLRRDGLYICLSFPKRWFGSISTKWPNDSTSLNVLFHTLSWILSSLLNRLMFCKRAMISSTAQNRITLSSCTLVIYSHKYIGRMHKSDWIGWMWGFQNKMCPSVAHRFKKTNFCVHIYEYTSKSSWLRFYKVSEEINREPKVPKIASICFDRQKIMHFVDLSAIVFFDSSQIWSKVIVSKDF